MNMPTQSPQARYHFPTGRPTSALIVRAGVARTFGSLGGFLATLFLGGGIYLLQEALSDPLQAQAVGLISGAFIIALATMLIYFIFSPRTKRKHRKASGKRLQRIPASGHFIDLSLSAPRRVERLKNETDDLVLRV
jgi:uncharacterized membrane protein YbhN (UPF0104 family)